MAALPTRAWACPAELPLATQAWACAPTVAAATPASGWRARGSQRHACRRSLRAATCACPRAPAPTRTGRTPPRKVAASSAGPAGLPSASAGAHCNWLASAGPKAEGAALGRCKGLHLEDLRPSRSGGAKALRTGRPHCVSTGRPAQAAVPSASLSDSRTAAAGTSDPRPGPRRWMRGKAARSHQVPHTVACACPGEGSLRPWATPRSPQRDAAV